MTIRIVIPTLNESAALPATLDAIARQPVSSRVVVVDGGSSDDTRELARARGAEVLEAPRGRGHQLRLGAEKAREDTLLFLHADTLLPAEGLELVAEVLRDPLWVGGRFRGDYGGGHALLRLAGYLSRFTSPLVSYGDQAMFVRREIYESIGGMEAVPIFEDVRLYARMRRAGRVAVLPLSVRTSSRRFESQGSWRQMWANLALVTAHRLGCSPERLAGFYTPHSPD